MSETNRKLIEAQQELVPTRVLLREAVVHCNDDFDPSSIDMVNLEFQYLSNMNNVDEAEFLIDELEDTDLNSESRMYIYRFTLGIRAIHTDDTEEVEQADSDGLDLKDEGFIQFGIKAVFETRYFSARGLDQDCIQIFGEKNVPFNLWPFWREYVHSTCLRMGFKQPAILPLMRPKTGED